jgi:hypothetical protein
MPKEPRQAPWLADILDDLKQRPSWKSLLTMGLRAARGVQQKGVQDLNLNRARHDENPHRL